MAWAKNGTPDTATGTTDELSIADLTAKKFNLFLMHTIAPSTNTSHDLNFNNNSNTVYAQRTSINGAADATATSQTTLSLMPSLIALNGFSVAYVVSISGEEKLVISNTLQGSTVGAGTAPNRCEHVGKFVPSPDADITRVDCDNSGTNDYTTDSNLSAIGTD